MRNDRDLAYHARRAHDEAIQAIRSLSNSASVRHEELCRLHCDRVLAGLREIEVREAA